MSFGISVGDFIAVGKLICDISSCLKNAGGAKTEYQDLVLGLDCLQKALTHLKGLQPQHSQFDLEAIKYTALSCKRPLVEFLDRLKKYEPSLGPLSTSSKWKAPVDKLRFKLSMKDDIQRMQSYLSVHVGILNLLLSKYSLETMGMVQKQLGMDFLQVTEQLEATNKSLSGIQSSMSNQSTAMYTAGTLLGGLCRIVNGEILTSLISLAKMVATIL